jgi:hypothetical protein
MTILASVLTLSLVLFSITSIIVAFFSNLTFRVFEDAVVGGAIGSLIVWVSIDYLWLFLTGNHTVILVYIASFFILGWHYSKVPDTLYGVEIAVMLMVLVYNLIF